MLALASGKLGKTEYPQLHLEKYIQKILHFQKYMQYIVDTFTTASVSGFHAHIFKIPVYLYRKIWTDTYICEILKIKIS